MIFLRLDGGLGNIMFQYALGRYMAHVNKSELRFDVDTYKTNPLGDYSLSLEAFNIDIQNKIASQSELVYMKRFQKIPRKKAFFHNLFFADTDKYIREKHYHFDPSVLSLRGDMYLHGWWQSEKYFKDIRPILLDDFTLRDSLSEKSRSVAKKISSLNSISVHIRRLDYVKNPKTRWYHGELPKSYYDAALEKIVPYLSDPTLFIFSDDIPWVKENMLFPFKTEYVEGNLALPHEDMTLMSLAKHNIVANSSFSWWGAWLNRNPEKIVVAPQPWVAETSKQDSKDVAPESWITIPAHYIRS